MRNIAEDGVPIPIPIDLPKRPGFLVEGRKRLSLRVKFLQPFLQHLGIIIVASDERAITIGTDRPFGEDRAAQARREAASLALQPACYPVDDGLLGHLEPDGQIEWCPMTTEDALQAFCLGHGAREPIENKTMPAMQPEPVFD